MKRIKIFAVFLALWATLLPFAAFAETTPNSAGVTDTVTPSYRVGYPENEIPEGYDGVTDVFSDAYGSLGEGYNATSHVTQENGYYAQTFSDGKNNASVYVKDGKHYTVSSPIYDYIDTVGGKTVTGYPVSDAYTVGEKSYQNFDNGYAVFENDSLSFVNGKTVNEKGEEIYTASPVTETETEKKTEISENSTVKNTTEKKTDTAGMGADETGITGTLAAAPQSDVLMTVVGLVVLAAVVILIVALSSSSAKA